MVAFILGSSGISLSFVSIMIYGTCEFTGSAGDGLVFVVPLFLHEVPNQKMTQIINNMEYFISNFFT